MSQTLSPTLFSLDNSEGWLEYLEENGFVVVKDILTNDEREQGLSIFKQDMAKVSPRFDFDDSSTWGIDTCPLMFGKGMAVFNGFGQSDFMWHLRTNSKIQSIFKQLYSTDELVASLDGFSMFVSKAQKSKSWLHVDQNPKNDMYSIQGAYNYFPVNNKEDAGFVLVPSSHKTYKPVMKPTGDWHVCNPQPITESRKLIIPENCMVLWNSRTIHANEGMTKQNIELNRLTCYVAYQPKHLRPETIKNKRIETYLSGKATSHYANKCEVKRYPFGFKTRYESRGFSTLNPRLNLHEDAELGNLTFEEKIEAIPIERLSLL